MRLDSWYIPSWTGDFRLDAEGDDKTLLTVEDPTAVEWARLNKFLVGARKENWIDAAEGICRTGRTELLLGTSVHRAGNLLAPESIPKKGVITAVTSVGGDIQLVVDGNQLPVDTLAPNTDGDIPLDKGESAVLAADAVKRKVSDLNPEIKSGVHDSILDEIASAEAAGNDRSTVRKAIIARKKSLGQEIPTSLQPKKAASVSRPTLCCPMPVQGPQVRASEVLKAFCTPEQWGQWLKHGWLIAYGGYTGHAYRICHRHTKLAVRQGKITMDLDDGVIVHCYDWSVPPPEEVLAIKLIMEHREPWLRNGSTLFGMQGCARDIFVNPLGHRTLDGTDDAQLVSGIAGGILGALWSHKNHGSLA